MFKSETKMQLFNSKANKLGGMQTCLDPSLLSARSTDPQVDPMDICRSLRALALLHSSFSARALLGEVAGGLGPGQGALGDCWLLAAIVRPFPPHLRGVSRTRTFRACSEDLVQESEGCHSAVVVGNEISLTSGESKLRVQHRSPPFVPQSSKLAVLPGLYGRA